MPRSRPLLILLLGSVLLPGCTTPFGQTVEMDWSKTPGAGTITVSDAKMYRREALINERNDEIAWLKDELDKSKTVDFKSDIVREVETIRQISGAVGLAFDPAAGLNYRRAAETGDLQQEIASMKLQLQLDQLKRDAQLVRDKLDAQTDPVNADLGKLGEGGGPGSATSQTVAAPLDQLDKLITRLDGLTTRLDAETRGAATANSGTWPGDTFRDRLAYRNLLKAARNAASLDEVHDLDGAALIRLNFQATVLPEEKYATSPALVQMRITPAQGEDDIQDLYEAWLAHINGLLNRKSGKDRVPDRGILLSPLADLFDVMEYRTGAQTDGCEGPVFEKSPAPNPKCKTLLVAVPRFASTSSQEPGEQTLLDLIHSFGLTGDSGQQTDDEREKKTLVDAHAILNRHRSEIAAHCGMRSEDLGELDFPKATGAINEARTRATVIAILESLLYPLEHDLQSREPLPERPLFERMKERAQKSDALLATYDTIAFASRKKCATEAAKFQEDAPKLAVPYRFRQTLEQSADRVRVYDVGPREQVQQVSTVARAADSIALAASLAASSPGSGVAANAAASYARQATGKAAQLERLPNLVGFANGGVARRTEDQPGEADGETPREENGEGPLKKSFGWVIGPRATVEPGGKVRLAHGVRPHDLSVDLSVPSWWRRLIIETETGWSPTPSGIVRGQVEGVRKTWIEVPMAPNTADFQALTEVMRRRRGDPVRVVDLQIDQKAAVSACRDTVLQLRGTNIWRTSAVLINDQKIDGASLTVTPNMDGVLVAVPRLGDKLGKGQTGPLTVIALTPYGIDDAEVDYEPLPEKGCKPAEEPEDKNAAKVTGIGPLRFRAAAAMPFSVEGVNLGKVTKATLNKMPGQFTAAADGKSMVITFTKDQVVTLPVSRFNKLVIMADKLLVKEENIEVTGDQEVE